MLRTSPTSVTQLLIGVADDEYGRGNCGKDETRILSIFFTFKKSTQAGYLTSGVKKGDYSAKRGNKNAKGFGYLTSNAKKTFNLLWHAFA